MASELCFWRLINNSNLFALILLPTRISFLNFSKSKLITVHSALRRDSRHIYLEFSIYGTIDLPKRISSLKQKSFHGNLDRYLGVYYIYNSVYILVSLRKIICQAWTQKFFHNFLWTNVQLSWGVTSKGLKTKFFFVSGNGICCT